MPPSLMEAEDGLKEYTVQKLLPPPPMPTGVGLITKTFLEKVVPVPSLKPGKIPAMEGGGPSWPGQHVKAQSWGWGGYQRNKASVCGLTTKISGRPGEVLFLSLHDDTGRPRALGLH